MKHSIFLSCFMFFLLGSCAPAPIKHAEKLVEKKKYHEASAFLANYLQTDAPDKLLKSRAMALQAEAVFYDEGPAAAVPLLRQLQTTKNKDYAHLKKRLREPFERLDQHIAKTQDFSVESAPHPWFEARIQWVNALQKKGKSFQELAESAEDPVIQSLVRWELARLDPSLYLDLLDAFPKSPFRPAWYQSYYDFLKSEEKTDQAQALLVDWKNELKQSSPLRAHVLLLQADFSLEKQPRAALN